MEKHYHAKDLIELLTKAKEKDQPVYMSGGPCGGCDLLIGPKDLPAYQAEGPCGGCDLVKRQSSQPTYQAEGACGGCDITIGEPKQLNVDSVLKRLQTEVNPLEPVYPGKGPCFGCDAHIKK